MTKRPFGYAGWPVAVIGQGTWRMKVDDRVSCIAPEGPMLLPSRAIAVRPLHAAGATTPICSARFAVNRLASSAAEEEPLLTITGLLLSEDGSPPGH